MWQLGLERHDIGRWWRGRQHPATLPVGSRILKMAFNANMQVPDPDIFYEVEGNEVVTSVYEGLVAYTPSSTDIAPALADSWTTSSDGMTYTFKLHRGEVPRWHRRDRDVVDRRLQAPHRGQQRARLHARRRHVDRRARPLTFVVHLKNPVSAFLDYLAAPYGPKAVSRRS